MGSDPIDLPPTIYRDHIMNILIILTSHDELGETGLKTGFWLEEFATPYFTLLDAGASITLASPKGGQPPIDPKSDEPDFQTAATERFKSCLLYTSPSPRDGLLSRMPSSA